jgi:hypothetical protein
VFSPSKRLGHCDQREPLLFVDVDVARILEEVADGDYNLAIDQSADTTREVCQV